MEKHLYIIIKFLLAFILGGIIGHERENINRPAGLRTHILVCVGSTLAMLTSEFIFNEYKGLTNLDPARLGAQVISGIGFLGAGTIIRDGVNVQGLTTAASLWAVACIGLAIGIGYYEGAIVATILIYLTLIFLKKVEKKISRKCKCYKLIIKDNCLVLTEIFNIFENCGIIVKKSILQKSNEDYCCIIFTLKIPQKVNKKNLITELKKLNDVLKVNELKNHNKIIIILDIMINISNIIY